MLKPKTITGTKTKRKARGQLADKTVKVKLTRAKPKGSAAAEAVLTKHNKFERYRAKKESQGFKLLRVWVPDPHRPSFAKEAERQAALLEGRQEEAETLAFINAAEVTPRNAIPSFPDHRGCRGARLGRSRAIFPAFSKREKAPRPTK